MATGCLVAASLGATPALAQDPVPAFEFDVNSVLVAAFEADQPFLEPEADRVRGLVQDALAQSYVVVGMAEVPAFTDYSAEIYLRSCPQGQYIGCVFVVGGRAETDWTIGGRVGAVEGGYQVDLSFIDVDQAKLVLEFDVVLDGSNDAEFKEGVVRVMDALVNGEVAQLDVRGDPEAKRAAEVEAKERESEARGFAADSIYEDLGDEGIGRGDVGLDAYVGDGEIERGGGRVTFQDLEEMAEAGGLTPWERAGLKKSQYRLYRNSGKKLRDFKAKLQGRKGEVIVRVGLGVNQGPWEQAHATGYLLQPAVDPTKAPRAEDIVSQSALQFQANALAFGGQLEIGGGVTSWLELLAFGGITSAPYSYNIVAESPSQDVKQIPDPKRVGRTSFNAGLKIGFIPMPAYPARPTLHLGASYWQGSAPSKVAEKASAKSLYASRMPGNYMVLAHIQPGFEVNAGKMITIFGRADVTLPMMGRTFQRAAPKKPGPYGREGELVGSYEDGGMFTVATKGDQSRVQAGTGFGIGANVGVTFRFRVGGLR